MARPRTKAKRLQLGIDIGLGGWLEWEGRSHPQGQGGYLNALAQADRAAKIASSQECARRYRLYLEACEYVDELEAVDNAPRTYTSVAGELVNHHHDHLDNNGYVRDMVLSMCEGGNDNVVTLADSFAGSLERLLDSMELLGVNLDVRVRTVADALFTFFEEVAPTADLDYISTDVDTIIERV